MIYWFTGNSGAGKTTITYGLKPYIPFSIVLDGDEMRKTISVEAGFTRDERLKHNLRVARLAKLLSNQEFIILVSVIAPYEEIRKQIHDICHPHIKWVHVDRNLGWGDERPYDPPENPDFIIDNNKLGKEQAIIEAWKFVL